MKVIAPNCTIFSGKHFFFFFHFTEGEGGGNMVVMYVVIQLDETISRVMGVVYVAQRRSNCRQIHALLRPEFRRGQAALRNTRKICE